MNSVIFRKQLHYQIDNLPDDIVQQVADFTYFIMARREIPLLYADWDKNQWRDFSLEQFFREGDEVEYNLKDAQEVYHP